MWKYYFCEQWSLNLTECRKIEVTKQVLVVEDGCWWGWDGEGAYIIKNVSAAGNYFEQYILEGFTVLPELKWYNGCENYQSVLKPPRHFSAQPEICRRVAKFCTDRLRAETLFRGQKQGKCRRSRKPMLWYLFTEYLFLFLILTVPCRHHAALSVTRPVKPSLWRVKLLVHEGQIRCWCENPESCHHPSALNAILMYGR